MRIEDTESTDRSGLMRRPWLLLLILAFALLIRVSLLPRESLWYDEVTTTDHLSEPTLEHFLEAVRYWNPKVPPLYLSVEYYWAKYIGDGRVSLRILSLIPGIFSIFLGYLLLAKIHSREAGLLTAYLMAVSASHIFYSLEIRMYSLQMVFVLFAVYSYFRLIESRTGFWWFVHVATTVPIVWNHQLGVIILPCLAIHAFFFGFGNWRETVKWCALQCAAVLSIIPWFLTVEFGNLGWEYKRFIPPVLFSYMNLEATSVQEILSNWINPQSYWITPLRYEWMGPIESRLMFLCNGIMIAFFVAVGAHCVWRIVRYFRNRETPEVAGNLIALMLLFFVPVASLFILSYVWEPVFFARYVLISMVAMMGCLSLSLVEIPRAKLRTFLISLMLACTIIQLSIDVRVPQRGAWLKVVQMAEAEPARSPRIHVMCRSERDLKVARQHIKWNIRDSDMKSTPYFSFDALRRYLLGGYARKTVGGRYLGDVLLLIDPDDLIQVTDYLDEYDVKYEKEMIPARDFLAYVRLFPERR